MPRRSAQSTHQIDHLCRMALGFDVVDRLANDAGLVDDEGGTEYAHTLLAVLFLLPPDIVGGTDLTVGIRQQRNRETVFIAKRGMAHAVVTADPDDLSVEGGKIIHQVRQLHRLDGTAGGIVLGIEVEHQIVAAEKSFRIHSMHVGIRQLERRGLVTRLQHVVSSLIVIVQGRLRDGR